MIVATSGWEFGWEALVAITTGVLAFFTWRLARQTAREVSHSGQQVELSRRQAEASNELASAAQLTLRAQIRPVLVDVPLDLSAPPSESASYPGRDDPVMLHPGAVHVNDGADEMMISFPLRNAGVGLAMIRGIDIWFPTPGPQPAFTINPANLAPGDRGRVSIRAVRGEPAFDQIATVIKADNFSIRVAFGDIVGQEIFRTRFDVYRQNGAMYGWIIRQVHFEDPDTREPFAGSAPIT